MQGCRRLGVPSKLDWSVQLVSDGWLNISDTSDSPLNWRVMRGDELLVYKLPAGFVLRLRDELSEQRGFDTSDMDGLDQIRCIDSEQLEAPI